MMSHIRQTEWQSVLKFDALSPLLNSENKAIALFVARDLTDQPIQTKELQNEKEAVNLLKKQMPAGFWKYPSKSAKSSQDNMDQYQTFKNLGILVEKYGFDKTHSAVEKTANYFFSAQTEECDFRGIYDKQYTPNYTGAIAELLIKAGYGSDQRIEQVFAWLNDTRQQDGGWALPFRTRGYNIDVTFAYPTTIQPDLSKPFSHVVTGAVLRAYAAHPKYKSVPEAKEAGRLLMDNLFQKDNYPDRNTPRYWLQFVFPFVYTDLISAMDTLSLLGFSPKEKQIQKALDWFIDRQQASGLWDFKITSGRDKDTTQLWLALAVCRIFKRVYDTTN